jgi:hypothetical protein
MNKMKIVSNKLIMKAYVIDFDDGKFVTGFTGRAYELMDVVYKTPFKFSRAIKNIELQDPKSLLFPSREIAEKVMNSIPNNKEDKVIRVNVDLSNSINAKAFMWSAEWLWNYMVK